MPVRLGLIGAGRWGRNLIRTMAAMDEVVLSRVASRNPGTPGLVPRGTVVTSDWTEVADAPDLDGVIIATPPRLHSEMARRAISNGLPTLIEKPLSLNLGEAREIGEAVSKSRTFAMVEHTHLHSAAFKALLQKAASLGPPRSVTTEAGNWGPFREGTPVLFDWGGHDFAMLLELFGEKPDITRAQCMEMRAIEGEGEGASWLIDMRFDETPVRVELSNLRLDKRRQFRVDFASAVLLYDDLAAHKLTLHPPAGPHQPIDATEGKPLPVEEGSPLYHSLLRFVQAVRRGHDDGDSLGLGIKVVETLADCEGHQ